MGSLRKITARIILFFLVTICIGLGIPLAAHAASLSLQKVCSPANDGGLFNLEIDQGGLPVAQFFNASCGAFLGPVNGVFGVYSVSESAGTGTNLSQYTVTIGGDCTSNGTVIIGNANDNKICTITNSKIGGSETYSSCANTNNGPICALVACDSGRGTCQANQCSISSDCPGTSGNTHTTCSSQSCVVVEGAGSNLCSGPSDCTGSGGNSHTECQNNTCTSVTGAGTNQCSTPQDCSGSGPHHTECNGLQQCVPVAGSGANLCSTSGDCSGGGGGGGSTSHFECNGQQQCVSITGSGADQCSTNADCSSGGASGTLMVNKICVPGSDPGLFNINLVYGCVNCGFGNPVIGVGSNVPCGGSASLSLSPYILSQCINGCSVSESGGTGTNLSNYTSVFGGDCSESGGVSWPPEGGTKVCTVTNTNVSGGSHLACISNACVSVSGAGSNQCASNPDCTPPTHLACSATLQCVLVNGTGSNLCQANGDCTSNSVTHLACSNQQCISVNGAGSNQCTTNENCRICEALPPPPPQGCTWIDDPNNQYGCQILSCPGATLVVKKHVIGGAAMAANFTMHVKFGGVDVFGSPKPGSESGNTYNLNPARYIVSENTPPAGYTATFSGDCNAQGAVDVVAGQTKTCIVTNTNQDSLPGGTGNLTVTKIVINDNGGSQTVGNFPLFVGSTPVTSGVQHSFNPGTYVVSEIANPSYNQTISGDCNAQGNVTVVAGVDKFCTIVNNDKPSTITVNKTVIANGGNATTASFAPYKVDTTTVTLGVATTFNWGTHQVSETTAPNYTTTFSGGCNASGVVTLNPGDNKICTITNTCTSSGAACNINGTGTITVNKTVFANGGNATASSFAPYKVDTTTVTLGVPTQFLVGSHQVSEVTAPNYDTFYSGDCSATGVVTLAPNDNKVCTITNICNTNSANCNINGSGTITVNKTVNNNGGNATATSFEPYKVDTTVVTLGVPNTFVAGSHQVSETTAPNYTTTFSGGCNASGVVTLNPGDNKICTITNTCNAPVGGCDINDNRPTATLNSPTNASCFGSPGTGMVVFSWTYGSPVGLSESKFQFQMTLSTDINYQNTVINRTFDNLSNSPGTVNQQAVLLYQVQVSDAILYNTLYRWRVQVWDSVPKGSGWVSGGTYQKTGHPDPFPSFTFSPSNPAVNSPVSFTKNSQCYNNSGPAACQSYLWNFGDSSTSTATSPTHSYISQGNYNVVLQASDGTASCQTNQTVPVGGVSTNHGIPNFKEISPF